MYSSIARLGRLPSGAAQVSNPLHFLNVSLLTGLDVKLLGVLPWEIDCGKVRLEVKTSKAIFGGRATFKYTLELLLGSVSMKLVAEYRRRVVGATDMPYGPNTEERLEREDAMFNWKEWPEREDVMSNAEQRPEREDVMSNAEERPEIEDAMFNAEERPIREDVMSNAEERPEIEDVMFNAEERSEREDVMFNAEGRSGREDAMSGAEESSRPVREDLISSLQCRFGPLPSGGVGRLTDVVLKCSNLNRFFGWNH